MMTYVDINIRREDAEREARIWARGQREREHFVQELVEESRYHAHLAMHSAQHSPAAEAALATAFATYALIEQERQRATRR